MPILRPILKYTSAVVLGLLVVAWWVGTYYRVVLFLQVGEGSESPPSLFVLGITDGSVLLRMLTPGRTKNKLWIRPQKDGRIAGRFHYTNTLSFQPPLLRTFGIAIPLLFLATTAIPLAIGPFVSFRFRIWHYLAYTALIAFQLAYYLRWQD